jgi:hypothetical protein
MENPYVVGGMFVLSAIIGGDAKVAGGVAKDVAEVTSETESVAFKGL